MTAAAELVLMDPGELETRLAESRKELFNLRFQLATGQLDNSARLGHVRKEVARILTILRDREIQEAEGAYEPAVAAPRAAAAPVKEQATPVIDQAVADQEEEA